MALKNAANLKKLAKTAIAPKTEASPKQIVASPVVAKAEVKPTVAVVPVISKESNLSKLAKSPAVMNFIKSKNGTWNHQDWLDFLVDLKKQGYDPIDSDQVGLLLEEKKAQYLAARG